jgi:hypothetical protein
MPSLRALGELQEIVAAMSRSSKEVEDRVEDVAQFLIVNRCVRMCLAESWAIMEGIDS